jgi:hypothetical protein
MNNPEIGQDSLLPVDGLLPMRARRRGLLRGLGLGTAAAAATMGTVGSILRATPAAAQGITDADVLNFALNLEYVEAEFYLRAVTGKGLSASMTSGTGSTGTVTGGSLVPFQNTAVAYYAQQIASDELAHVLFLRSALGGAAVAEPTIDLVNSFTTLAIAAGLIAPGQTFNPFASEVGFLLGAYIFEDVGVSAYAGAATALTTPSNLNYAARILAIEAYHAGGLRSRLSEIGAGTATNAISALRAKLGGIFDNGTSQPGNPYSFVNRDANSLAGSRTPAQVLSVVYGGGAAGTGGLFYPNGMNGTIR